MVPLLACGGFAVVVWKCVKVVEGVSKQAFKRQLANAIVTSSVFTVGKLAPRLLLSAFDAIFTGKLWSLRGFVRSSVASVILITILFGLWYSSIPEGWELRIAALGYETNSTATTWFLIAVRQSAPGVGGVDIGLHGELTVTPPAPVGKTGINIATPMMLHRLDVFVILPFFYNLFFDFTALLITRGVARRVLNRNVINLRRLIMIFFLSSVCILTLSSIAIDLSVALTDYIVAGRLPSLATTTGETIFAPRVYLKAILFPFYKNHPELLGGWTVGTMYGVYIWSTLMGLVWLGIFGVSLVIANYSMKLRVVGPWLDANFRVRSQPFRVLAILAIISVSGPCLIYHFFQSQ